MSIMVEVKNIFCSIDNFIGDHHMLVVAVSSCASLIVAINGMLNSKHLREMAKLQRNIETNRYYLQLFDSRVEAFDEFKTTVKLFSGKKANPYSEERLNNSLHSCEKCIALFGGSEGNSLSTLYEALRGIQNYVFVQRELESEYTRLTRMSGELLASPESPGGIENESNHKLSDLTARMRTLEDEIQNYTREIGRKYESIADMYEKARVYILFRLKVPQNAVQSQD